VDKRIISVEAARPLLSNSIEVTYEKNFSESWNYFVTGGYLYSQPGDRFYGKEGALYEGRVNQRITNGGVIRGGLNWNIISSQFLKFILQLSPFLSYKYSYFNRKLICYGDCPPSHGLEAKIHGLTIESADQHTIAGGVLTRFRFTVFKPVVIGVWFGVKGGQRFEQRTIHEDIYPYYDPSAVRRTTGYGFVCPLGKSCEKNVSNTDIQAIGGIKLGLTFK
jgi:hypothetical protein